MFIHTVISFKCNSLCSPPSPLYHQFCYRLSPSPLYSSAMDGVLSGKYKPLDFRFFIGHTRYAKGQLEDAVVKGKYQPIACSRPLVLKQCIQLPTPLWHEGKEDARVQLCVHDSWFHSPPLTLLFICLYANAF